MIDAYTGGWENGCDIHKRWARAVSKPAGAELASYSRFEAADGSSMLAIANYSDSPLEVCAEIGETPVREFRAIEDDGFSAAGKTLTIAPHSAVVAR